MLLTFQTLVMEPSVSLRKNKRTDTLVQPVLTMKDISANQPTRAMYSKLVGNTSQMCRSIPYFSVPSMINTVNMVDVRKAGTSSAWNNQRQMLHKQINQNLEQLTSSSPRGPAFLCALSTSLVPTITVVMAWSTPA